MFAVCSGIKVAGPAHWDTLQRILQHPSPRRCQRITEADRPVIGPWLGRLGQ